MSGDGSGDFGRRGSGEGSVDETMVDDEDFVSPQLRRMSLAGRACQIMGSSSSTGRCHFILKHVNNRA